jgi:excisionase family DNA binding protein
VEGAVTYLTVRDVADRFQVSPRTVERLIGIDLLRAVRIGRQVRIRPADLPEKLPETPRPSRRVTTLPPSGVYMLFQDEALVYVGRSTELKTAQALVLEQIVPCSEDKLKALAKTHGIGRKLGRAYVFTPADVAALVEKLPCPSSSSPESHGSPYWYIRGSVRGIRVDESTGCWRPQGSAPKKSSSSGRRKSSRSHPR